MNEKAKVYFRADGNSVICSGHIMRCLSLAEAMRSGGAECVFITADDNPARLISRAGFKHIVLKSRWDELDGEISAIVSLLNERKPAFLVLDTYYASEKYMSSLNKIVPIIYIDDLNAFDYPVSCVVNYNIYAEELHYSTKIPLILGTQYAPLREEFVNVTPKVRENVQNLLILTGGADPQNVMSAFLESFLNSSGIKGLRLHVVLGALIANKKFIYKTAEHFQNVIIHENVVKMSELMKDCDIAISAAGSTLYELCACGVPTLSYSFADNQLLGARCFDEKGLIPYAGDVRDSTQKVINRACEILFELIKNQKLRTKRSLLMRNFCDGMGANKLAEELIEKFVILFG